MTVIALKSAQHLFCSRSNWLISTTLDWLMAWRFSFRNSKSDIALKELQKTFSDSTFILQMAQRVELLPSEEWNLPFNQFMIIIKLMFQNVYRKGMCQRARQGGRTPPQILADQKVPPVVAACCITTSPSRILDFGTCMRVDPKLQIRNA